MGNNLSNAKCSRRFSLKIFFTGRNSQVGFELQRLLAPLGQVIALDPSRCDLANPESLRAAIRARHPASPRSAHRLP